MLAALASGDRSREQIAADFHIALPTLQRIMRTRDSIIELGATEGEKTRIRSPHYANVREGLFNFLPRNHLITPSPFQIESELLTWIQQETMNGVMVSGKMMKDEALQIAIRLGQNNFPASNGWLDNFRKRHHFSRGSDVKTEEVRMKMENGEITVHFDVDSQKVKREGRSHHQSAASPVKRKRVAVKKELQEEEEEVVCEDYATEEIILEEEQLMVEEEEEDQLQQTEVVYAEEVREEEEEAEEEENVKEYSKEEAIEAHQILVAYFNSHEPPPGTFMSLQRIGEALGSGSAGEAYVVEEVYQDEDTGDDDVTIEVEIQDDRYDLV